MKKTFFLFSLLITSYACSAMEVNISGIDKKALLQALYSNAAPKGYGWCHYIPSHILPDQEMASILEKSRRIDYLHGRAMKIDISEDSVDTSIYNEYNGKNLAEMIIGGLRK